MEFFYAINSPKKRFKHHPQGFKDDSNGIVDNENDYTYDANGNLTSDQNKGITNITYNHLNLPTEVEFGVTGKIEYLYNATGQKIQKNVVDPSTTPVVTDYMNGGFQYTNNVLSFFPHAEGYVNVILGKRGSLVFNYVYQYKDHLGNNRLNFSLDPLGVSTTEQPNPLKIIEENHYYPFGLKHTSYNTNQYAFVEVENGNDYYMNVSQLPAGGVSNYKYKYNGKELQDELGLNVTAMDFRQYDSAIGRFNGMDRLSEFAYSITPYRFAYNNPVYWNDPTGLFENLAHCPTCPNTPKFKSLIDDPNNEYFYDPETDTASKVLQLNEIEVENIKPSSSSSNWSSWFYFHNGFTLWNDEGRGNTPGLKNGTIKHSINTKTIPTMSGPHAMRGNKNWFQTLLHAISNLLERKQKGDTVEEIIKENNTPPSIEKQNAEPVAPPKQSIVSPTIPVVQKDTASYILQFWKNGPYGGGMLKGRNNANREATRHVRELELDSVSVEPINKRK